MDFVSFLFLFFQENDEDEMLPTLAAILEDRLLLTKSPSLHKCMSQKSMIIPGSEFFHSPQLSIINKVIIAYELLLQNAKKLNN